MADVVQADLWRMTSVLQSPVDNNPIDPITNWGRPTNQYHGRIGSGMSVNSGIFSFPEVGAWMIKWIPQNQMKQLELGSGGQYRYIIYTTDDDSTWIEDSAVSAQHSSTRTAWDGTSLPVQTFLNVTNISLQKVKFAAPPVFLGGPFCKTMGGAGTVALSNVLFIKVGS